MQTVENEWIANSLHCHCQWTSSNVIQLEKKLPVVVMHRAYFVQSKRWIGEMDDLLEFLMSPVVENMDSTGTDDALGVKNVLATKERRG